MVFSLGMNVRIHFHSNCLSLCGWLLLLRLADIHAPSSESIFPAINVPTNPVKQTQPIFQVIEIHVRFVLALLFFSGNTFCAKSWKNRVNRKSQITQKSSVTRQTNFTAHFFNTLISVTSLQKGKISVCSFSIFFFFMLCVTPALIEQMTCYKITRKLQYCTTPFFSVVLFFLLPLWLSLRCKKKKVS